MAQKTWYLRAASLARADLFQGAAQTRGGKTKIIGGEFREYEPREVVIVPPDRLDDIRHIIEEHRYDARRPANVDDSVAAYRRDGAESDFARRIMRFVKEYCEPADPELQFRHRARADE